MQVRDACLDSWVVPVFDGSLLDAKGKQKRGVPVDENALALRRASHARVRTFRPIQRMQFSYLRRGANGPSQVCAPPQHYHKLHGSKPSKPSEPGAHGQKQMITFMRKLGSG